MYFAGGQKREAFEAVARSRAGTRFGELLAYLSDSVKICKAPSTRRVYEAATKGRREWCAKWGFPDDESSFLLYLANRSQVVGSSAIAMDRAAFTFSNGSLSNQIEKFAGGLMESKRRQEVDVRADPASVSKGSVKSRKSKISMWFLGDIDKIWNLWSPTVEAKRERDVLIAVLSREALLRSAEAAELKWDNLDQIGSLLKVSKDIF